MTHYTESEKNEFVLGYLLGRKNGKGGQVPSSDDNDVWEFPEHWLDIPEPEDNQIIIYYEINANGSPYVPPISFYDGYKFGGGTIDWGDGCIDSIPNDYSYACSHIYSFGQYIATITCNYAKGIYLAQGAITYMNGEETRMSLTGSDMCWGYPKAIKVGRNVGFPNYTYYIDSDYRMGLKYLKYIGERDYLFAGSLTNLEKIECQFKPDTILNENCLNGCDALYDVDFLNDIVDLSNIEIYDVDALRKINLPNAVKAPKSIHCCDSLVTVSLSNATGIAPRLSSCPSLRNVNISKCTELPEDAFASCYSLKTIDLPLITNIPAGAFNNCPSLVTINAPNCINIDIDNFKGCYRLRKLNVAEGCTFNGNYFKDCPLIYPKPTN